MKEKLKLTPLEKSWILYDIGNSAFILLVTTLIPIYFNALSSAAGLDESKYLAYWGYAGSAATLLVAFIGPICGTLADQKGYKKPIFLLSMMLGALGCAALGAAWSWLSFLVIFVIARVGYNSANVFYDAMLPEVATPERMDRVSSLGYAFGYIGSVIPFVLCLVLVLLHDSFGLSQSAAFPLHLRIPSWAKGATAAIEGEIIPAQAGTILTINRQWNDGDELLLTLPMTTELLPGFHQAVSVARGPLRFAHVPAHEQTEDADGCVILSAREGFGIALCRDAGLSAEETEDGVVLHASGVTVPAWGMRGGSCDQPPITVSEQGERVDVTLVPYAASPIRLSLFPLV